MAGQSPDTTMQPCALFEKLPAELRNTIYELSFTNDNDDAEINLLEANPPSKALLLICQQANSEAKGLYAEASRKYWSGQKFTISCMKVSYTRRFSECGRDQVAAKAVPCAIPDEHLAHIRHMSIKTSGPAMVGVRTAEMVDPRGRWRSASGLPGILTGNEPYFYVALTNEEDGSQFRCGFSEDEMKEWLSRSLTAVPLRQQLLALAFDTDEQLRKVLAAKAAAVERLRQRRTWEKDTMMRDE